MEPANRDPLWCTYGRLDSHAVHGSEANHGGVFKSVLGEAVRLGIPEARVCCVCCASRVLRDHARHDVFEGLILRRQSLQSILDDCCLP